MAYTDGFNSTRHFSSILANVMGNECQKDKDKITNRQRKAAYAAMIVLAGLLVGIIALFIIL